MIGQTVIIFMAVGACVSATVARHEELNLKGVDPNTLSCDAEGQEYLLLPHFTDCDKFYKCAHGREVEFTCPGDSIFDFEGQGCNWVWAANCTLRSKDEEDIDEEGSGSGDDYDVNELLGSNVVHDASVDQALYGKLILSPYSGILNCNKAADASKQLAYRGDCQRYWRCVDGVVQAVYCSDGLFFNDKTQQCDFEGNVKCAAPSVDELENEYIVYK